MTTGKDNDTWKFKRTKSEMERTRYPQTADESTMQRFTVWKVKNWTEQK